MASREMDDERTRAVFNELDVDGDGIIQYNDVEIALKTLGLPLSAADLHEFLARVEPANGSGITYPEFASFVMLHDDILRRVYNSCFGSSGSPEQLRKVLQKLNVHVSKSDSDRLHERIRNGSLGFPQFCSVLLMLPSQHATQFFMHWWDTVSYEAGDDIHIPGSAAEVASWKLLVAGAVAGLVSRTATAPIDRVKTILQAQAALNPTVAQQHVSMRATWAAIIKEGGLRSFWRGNGTNCVKIMPETALKFLVYERLRDAICDDPREMTIFERLTVGAAAGSVAQAFIYPLEVVKTRMAVATTGQYQGIIHCMTKSWEAGGVRALYRGLSASLLGIIPYSGVDLCVYSLLRDWYSETYGERDPGVLTLLGCGGIATTCGQLVAYPLQLLRTRLQAQGAGGAPVRYSGLWDCARQTWRQEGLHGFYRGLTPNFLKALPAISISYAVYESLKVTL